MALRAIRRVQREDRAGLYQAGLACQCAASRRVIRRRGPPAADGVVDLPPGTGDIALSLVQSVPLTGAVVVSTPSDVSLQDARKAIEMFRQMKVDLVGVVENMSYFVCPHCNHEIDIFSRGGAEKMAQQFSVPFLGSIELDPEVRKSGDGGKPIVLEGENSPHAKSIFAFARRVVARVGEIKATESASVIQIQ